MKVVKKRAKQAFFGIALIVVLAAIWAVSYYSVNARIDAETKHYENQEWLHKEIQKRFDTVPSIDSSGV